MVDLKKTHKKYHAWYVCLMYVCVYICTCMYVYSTYMNVCTMYVCTSMLYVMYSMNCVYHQVLVVSYISHVHMYVQVHCEMQIENCELCYCGKDKCKGKRQNCLCCCSCSSAFESIVKHGPSFSNSFQHHCPDG